MKFNPIENYDEAVQYLNRQRNMVPPVYNLSRLFELPVPNPDEIAQEQIDEQTDGQIDANNHSVVEEEIGNNREMEANENNGDIERERDEIENQESENNGDIEPVADEIENENSGMAPQFEFVKVEHESIYAISDARNDEVYDLLDEAEIVELSDGDEMIIGEKGLPKPKRSTVDGCIKRENDAVSGNKPFYETVSYSFHILI